MGQRVRHARLRLRQSRTALKAGTNQAVELRIVEGLPPSVGDRFHRRAGQADACVGERRRMRGFLRRQNAPHEKDA